MVLGVLRRLRLVLLLDRRRAVLVGDRAIGNRARHQRRQDALRRLLGLAHRGRVEQQHRGTLGARQARRRDHRLDDAVQRRQQVVDPAEQRLELVELEHPRVVGHRPRQRIRAEVEPRDHAEEAWPGTTSGPQQVGVLLLVGPDQLAVGGDDVDRGDVLHAQPYLRPFHPWPPWSRKPSIRRSGSARRETPGRVRSGTAPARPRLSLPGSRWRSRCLGRSSSRASDRGRSGARRPARSRRPSCDRRRAPTPPAPGPARAARRQSHRHRFRPAVRRPGSAPAGGR